MNEILKIYLHYCSSEECLNRCQFLYFVVVGSAMETYLTLLYVTLEQEVALKHFFTQMGWTYCKPDLRLMTDQVGPYESPQTFVTKTGGIIAYSHLSENESGSVKANLNKELTERGETTAAVSPDENEIKIELVGEDGDVSDQLFSMENTIDNQTMDSINEVNHDSFADDFDPFVAAKENDNNFTESTDSATKMGRKPVGKAAKVTCRKRGRKSEGGETPESSSTVQEECSVKERKKRKVAADAAVKIECVIEDEQQEQTSKNPVVLMKDIFKLMTKPEKKKAPKTKLQCSMCQKEYKLQFQLDRHFKREHDPDNPPKKPTPRKKPQVQQCDICGSVFSRSDNLKEHKRSIHQGIKKEKTLSASTCETCGLTFKRRDHLKEHILIKHSDSRLPHACELCEKSFIRHRFLEMHVNRDHLKVKPFACSYCNRQFFSQHSAKHHIKLKICQPDRERNFKCNQCEKRFATAAGLEMHMTALHFGGAFRCICGEVVKWESSVAKHKRRCKMYQEYVAVHGATEDKSYNIIEVPLNEVVSAHTGENSPVKNSAVTPSADSEPPDCNTTEDVSDNAENEENDTDNTKDEVEQHNSEMEETSVEHDSLPTDLESENIEHV